MEKSSHTTGAWILLPQAPGLKQSEKPQPAANLAVRRKYGSGDDARTSHR
jgi:hypothetical protein